jgi:hypothetical protein
MASIELDASEVDVLLYQMILFCGEFFNVALVASIISSWTVGRIIFSSYSSSDSSTYLMQVDPRNSGALFANHSRNAFLILDAY